MCVRWAAAEGRVRRLGDAPLARLRGVEVVEDDGGHAVKWDAVSPRGRSCWWIPVV